MATPHAPIAILLLSHLQALYNIIILTFIIAISLFSGRRGRRGRHCNSTAPTGGGKGVESVDRREGVGRKGSIATPK